MNFELFKQYEPLYIIGHKNPDVDSVVSTVLLTNILKSKGIECYPCFLKDEYKIGKKNAKMIDDCMELDMKIIDNDSSYNYVLVDHNDPIQSVGFGKRIVWGIDHHKNSGVLTNIMIKGVCSCSLYIYEFFKDYYLFSNEEKFMIYMATLADTFFFKGSRYTEEDKVLIDKLGYNMDADVMFKKYFIPTDLSDGIDKVFDKVSKSYSYKGIVFDSVVIKTYNENDFMKQDFIKRIENTNNFLGVWVDLDKEMSYAYFNCNGEVKEFIYDFIASRAASVIPDVFSYIDLLMSNQ